MLQEYMVENQHLKEENETLRTEKTQIYEKLQQEEKNNEKITKEVSQKNFITNNASQNKRWLSSLTGFHISHYGLRSSPFFKHQIVKIKRMLLLNPFAKLMFILGPLSLINHNLNLIFNHMGWFNRDIPKNTFIIGLK